MSINTDEVATARKLIMEAAQNMLEGAMPYVAGSRLIDSLIGIAGLDAFSKPLGMIAGIVSDTDTVPSDAARSQWSTDALNAHADEWDRLENWAKIVGESACRSLIAMLSAD